MKYFDLPEITEDITRTSYSTLYAAAQRGDFVYKDGVIKSLRELENMMSEGPADVHVSEYRGRKVYQIVVKTNQTLQKKYQELFSLRMELTKANVKIEELEGLLRETVMRANFALPETNQDLKWCDEGAGVVTYDDLPADFIERVFKELGLGKYK